MFAFAVVLCLAVAANGASLVPLDTAEVRSDRVGDNFAYSIRENRGYAAVNPGLVYPYTALHSGVQTAYVKPVEVKTVPYYAPTVDVKTVAAVPYTAAYVKPAEVKTGAGVVPYAQSVYPYSAGVVPVGYVGGASVGSYAVPYTQQAYSYAYPQQAYSYAYPQQTYSYAYPQQAYAYNIVKSDKV